mgnify:CR=1 FL=1
MSMVQVAKSLFLSRKHLTCSMYCLLASNILVNELKLGGKIIFIRHAYAPGNGDPDNFSINDCSTQRNLSDEGRDQAKEIGNLVLTLLK